MHDTEKAFLRAVACYTKNRKIRMESTSGGIFSELAQKIIADGGVVFGAKFDEKFQVVHDYAESVKELEDFRGSKYPQSKIGQSYIKAKQFLEEGRMVMFSGTACQIAGLLCFLKKDYKNLFCVDFICYGVASPRVWNEYLNTYCDVKKIQKIRFKDKKYGWKSWDFMIKESKKTIREKGSHSVFMNGYLNRLYLRPSCYSCSFKGMENRRSDFTISDCWGIDVLQPQFYDDRGISGLYIHTKKGNDFFDSICDKIEYIDISAEQLLKYNQYAIKNVSYNTDRGAFFKMLDNPGISRKKVFKTYYTMKGCRNFLRRKLFFPIKNQIYRIRKAKSERNQKDDAE